MNELKAPSLQSLLESDRGSNDSLLAESLQLDIEDLDDDEYSIPALDIMPTLESVLSELEGDSDIASEVQFTSATPTPSVDDSNRGGSLLRHIILQGITSQISSAADRINAGFATSVAVSQMIAVGTSHGHILNFDSAQTLRWAHQDQTSQGAVSALAYNEDVTRLLAGFARGLVIMIDTSSGDLLRSLNDVITPNSGVLNLKWTGRPALALCSDSGGSVWSLSFTRKLGIRGCASRCLFSGARGEVCAIEPLILEDEGHELQNYSIVALATLSKYFVVTIRPRLRVVKFYVLNGPPECLPLLAWQMVLIQAADTSRTVDPVLAVARGNQLYFHQIFATNGRINLLFLRHVQMSYNLLSLHWLGSKSIACLDTSEMLHLADVRSSKEIECVDMANAGLVYSSAQFKGLATGGNVSPALALAGTHACYNSVASKGSQFYILGARSLHVVSVRHWNERISYLVHNHRWVEACELALDGYRAAFDRPRRKQQAHDRIVELFHEYVSSTNRTPEFCLGPIMKCLIEIGEMDLLWQELWDRLTSPAVFLNLITEHIENDEIKRLNPNIAQALVDYWANLSPSKLEDIILKMDWTCLDLHQVLTVAKAKKLYKAQIYLNTHALNDYTISLMDFIPLICTESRDLGNCMLVYISSCLAGRSYPAGEIPPDQVPNVKHDVLRSLTSIHSNRSDETELPYPYLRALLQFDTRETLNVISLAFQEREFSGELGMSHRQRIVYILLEIMTPENATWSQIGCLLYFISQQVSARCLPDDASLVERITDYLVKENIEGESPREHSEREQAWLELLTSSHLTHIPFERQLEMANRSKCYTVREYLLEKLGQFEDILECYLNNPFRHLEVFLYIEQHASNSTRNIYPQVVKHFAALMRIDADRITKIAVDHFSDKIPELIAALSNEPKLLYTFLGTAPRYGFALEVGQNEKYVELMCQENPEQVKEFLTTNENYRLENALEIVTKYQLTQCCIYLYEKQGDYQVAFNLSMELLREAPESTAESYALQLMSLCSRASQVLSEKQREEFWFPLLTLVLSRPDLSSITRSTLHLASQHVDLSKLVQLVLNCGTQSGSFGDIKHLLVGMLSNSRYENLLLETTARILGRDLHNKFVQERKSANRGLWITVIKCVVCRQRLYNQMDVLVFGSCGHSIHQTCIERISKSSCPRCGTKTSNEDPVVLAKPSLRIVDIDSRHSDNINSNNTTSEMLNVNAPPRQFHC